MADSILYIGHPYHALTRSTAFMVELLRELGPVRVETTDSWNGEIAEDEVFIFQSEEAARRVAQMGKPFIFAPMYDSSWDLGEWFWKDELKGLARVLCFSRTQFEQLRDWGLDCLFVRFFPAIAPAREWPAKFLSGSFWWRLEALPLGTILTLAGNQLDRLHVHLGADPGQTIDEAVCNQAKIPIEITRWGEDRIAYANASSDSRIFFAPRLKEGIGMSFLEALAEGRVVVAADDSTMNEYVTDGVTGFLYDPADPKEVDLKDSIEMGRRARESVLRGKNDWEKDQRRLLNWISRAERPSVETVARRTEGVDVFVKDTGTQSDLDRTVKSLATPPQVYTGSRPKADSRRWCLDLWAGDELLSDLPKIMEAAPAEANRIIGHYVEQNRSNDYERRVAPPTRISAREFLGQTGALNFSRMPHPSAELVREGCSGITWHCDQPISRIRDRGFAWKCQWSREAVRELLQVGASKEALTNLSETVIRADFRARRKDGLPPWSSREAVLQELAILRGMVFDQGIRAAARRFFQSAVSPSTEKIH